MVYLTEIFPAIVIFNHPQTKIDVFSGNQIRNINPLSGVKTLKKLALKDKDNKIQDKNLPNQS